MKTLERHLEARLVNACKNEGIVCIKGSVENNKGFPDRIVFHHKKHVIYFVEIKAGGYYKMTPTQKLWKDIIVSSGGKHFIVTGAEEMSAFILNFIL